ncbi:MAG: NUDIX domain-containing protein [Pseudomonadota bacterium]|nr:NUDIX domain-containing protein [Pseudomonadota bacterium]
MKITDKFVEPLPSATVLLVRDIKDRLEVLLLLRRKDSSFGSSYVFPGGLVDKTDIKLEVDIDQKKIINQSLDLVSGGYSYYSAAIRELFEEAGVLLVVDMDGKFPSYLDIEEYRIQLNTGKISWDKFLSDNQLSLNCGNMIYFAFWITPLNLSQRFSTRFFVSEIPSNQTASHCGNELIDSRWISPRDALIARRKKEINIPHPTAITLMQIRDFDSVKEVLEWANIKLNKGVPCYFPQLTASELRGDVSLE